MEYLYEIEFKTFPISFKYKGIEYVDTWDDVPCIRCTVDIPDYEQGSEKWENAMYDEIFDNHKGTEWGNVKQIEI